MDIFGVLLLSIGLAMDSFTVSLCQGACLPVVSFRRAAPIALCFGFFQAFMPVIGWVGGSTVSGIVAAYDHWVAFGLLAFIGARMIRESLAPPDCPPTSAGTGQLLILGVATSIDALAVGLSFAFLDRPIAFPVASIGVITAGLSYLGVHIGKRAGSLLQGKASLAGGIILIGIGLRILVEHLNLLSLVHI